MTGGRLRLSGPEFPGFGDGGCFGSARIRLSGLYISMDGGRRKRGGTYNIVLDIVFGETGTKHVHCLGSFATLRSWILTRLPAPSVISTEISI